MSRETERELSEDERSTLEEIVAGKLPEIDKISDRIKRGEIPRNELVTFLEQGLSKYLEYFEKKEEYFTLDKYFDEYFRGKHLLSEWKVYSLDEIAREAQRALKAIQKEEPIPFWDFTIKKIWELVDNGDVKVLYGNGEILYCDDIKKVRNCYYCLSLNGNEVAWLDIGACNIEEKVEQEKRNNIARDDIKQLEKKYG